MRPLPPPVRGKRGRTGARQRFRERAQTPGAPAPLSRTQRPRSPPNTPLDCQIRSSGRQRHTKKLTEIRKRPSLRPQAAEPPPPPCRGQSCSVSLLRQRRRAARLLPPARAGQEPREGRRNHRRLKVVPGPTTAAAPGPRNEEGRVEVSDSYTKLLGVYLSIRCSLRGGGEGKVKCRGSTWITK
nr:serine/arginine repetitive matrix protein 1-like [Saimiri boliviensis boliviensis]